MSRTLTVWISPLQAPSSLDDAVAITKAQAESISSGARVFAPSLLLPTHYGPWPQAQCNQNLPRDLLVDTPEDITRIRERVEAAGVGFGVWGVPLDNRSAGIAAQHAEAAGYYAANFEPGREFWAPGDNVSSIDRWWRDFWDTLSDPAALNGNVGVTIIPDDWGLGAFSGSFTNLLGGANQVLMEAYGGPHTPEYPYPNLWPIPAATRVRTLNTAHTPVVCILSNLNLQEQALQASRIGAGNVHSWFCR